MTFIDALMFTWGMKLVVGGDGYLFILVYALGKTLGTWIGDITEKKLAIGTLDITIMARREKAHQIADYLRSLGYVSNSTKTYGLGGEEKWDVRFFIKRKEYEFIVESLDRLGFKDVSMVITDVNKVTGKIKTSHRIDG
jgi:uncharacterized protein YebE (UPF0316 family)